MTTELDFYLNPTMLQTALIGAKALAESQIVPKDYQGKPENCLVAIELAHRWNMSPLMVMQGIPIIQGRPGLEGKFALALLRAQIKLTDFGWNDVGQKGTLSYGKEFWAVYEDGKKRTGQAVTLQIADDFGWSSKNAPPGMKMNIWKSQPETMLTYRAVSYFIRQWEPGVLMGLSTKDEVEDIEAIDVTPKPEQQAKELAAVINQAIEAVSDKPVVEEPTKTTVEVDYLSESLGLNKPPAASKEQAKRLWQLITFKTGLTDNDQKLEFLNVTLQRATDNLVKKMADVSAEEAESAIKELEAL